MKNTCRVTLLLLGTLLLVSPQARSQIAPPLSVTGSGAVYGTNGTYRINGTLGQPAIGSVAAVATTTAQGFWYAFPRSAVSALIDPVTTGTSSLELAASPNPFSASTELSIRIPRPGHVSLVLYNVLGQPFRTLIDADQPEGTVNLQLAAEDIPSGRYTLHLMVGSDRQTLSLAIVK